MGLAQVNLAASVQGLGTSQMYDAYYLLPPPGIKGRDASVKRIGVGYYRVFDNGSRWEVMAGESVVSSLNYCQIISAATAGVDVKFPIFNPTNGIIGVGETWKFQYWTSATNTSYSRIFIDGVSPAMQTTLNPGVTLSTKTINRKSSTYIDNLEFNGGLGTLNTNNTVELIEISLKASAIGGSVVVTNLILTRVS